MERWTEWVKVDVSDPAEDKSSAVQNAGLWLHNQAAADVTVCKLSPVYLRENSTWGGSIRMSMHQLEATSLPFQNTGPSWELLYYQQQPVTSHPCSSCLSAKEERCRRSQSPSAVIICLSSGFHHFNSVFNKKVTLTVEEAVLVWTSSRVGAPWLQKRKWSVSLSPTALTCSRSPSGGNKEEPGFNSTDNWGRRRETNLSIISTKQNRERQKQSCPKRVVIIWQVND